jgi:hypothetical protein
MCQLHLASYYKGKQQLQNKNITIFSYQIDIQRKQQSININIYTSFDYKPLRFLFIFSILIWGFALQNIYMKEHKLMRLGQKAYRKRKKEERKRV